MPNAFQLILRRTVSLSLGLFHYEILWIVTLECLLFARYVDGPCFLGTYVNLVSLHEKMVPEVQPV